MDARAFVVLILLAAPAAATVSEDEGARYVVGLVPGHLPLLPASAPALLLPELSTMVVVVHDERAFLAAARADPSVRYVARDDPHAARAAGLLDDPLLAQQPGLARMRVPEAWDVTRGNAAVSVCVVDSGVRATHEDVVGPRYLGGIDVANADLDPADDLGHGTHVAGTIAATTGNGLGGAGIAQVALRAAKVLDERGAASWAEVAAGIVWCAKQGSHVIAMSLAGPTSSPVLEAAVGFAHERGALLVAASGNVFGCMDCVHYPARLPHVVAVGCWSDAEDLCESGSAGGPELDLVAPGESVLAPWHDADDAYARLTGTSMAAARVAGVASLVWSAQPALPAHDVHAFLVSSAQDVGAPGPDLATGGGLVDAFAATALASAS